MAQEFQGYVKAKLEEISKDMKQVNDHLARLNGQVAKNTEWRNEHHDLDDSIKEIKEKVDDNRIFRVKAMAVIAVIVFIISFAASQISEWIFR